MLYFLCVPFCWAVGKQVKLFLLFRLLKMGDKKDANLYCNFSRKYLQGLCKKYGLPANKTSSEMATSLILYLERRNLTSQTICKGTKSDHSALSSAFELQSGARINSVDDGRKDCYGNSCGNGRCSSPQQQNALQNFSSGVTSNKACQNVQLLPQLQHRDSNGGSCLPENAISSVVNSSTEVSSPTFQFNVSCEDGIELFVDLNSSSSEWVLSMKSAIHIHHDMYNNKYQSYHKEFEGTCCPKQKKGSFLQNVDSDLEINDSHEDRSCPTSLKKEGGHEPIISNGDGSLSVSALEQSINVGDRLEHSQRDQVVLSCRHESGVEKQNICCTKYCRGDRERMVTDLDVIEATQIQSLGNLVVKTSLHGVKCFAVSENETLRPAVQICQNSSQQGTLSPVNPIAEVVRHSATSSRDMQECSVAAECRGTQNDISVDLIEQTQNFEMEKVGVIDAVPLNQGASQIHSLDIAVQRNGESCCPCIYSGSEDLIQSTVGTGNVEYRQH
ncbi:hypothetical protein Ancab_010650 [Ancistrocladus abbreviatus]